jgi:hypothetical protein
MKLKIISKLFSKPSKIESSKVEVTVEPVEDYEVNEKITKGLRARVKKELHGIIEHQLSQMCYTQEEIDDTNNAAKEYGGTKGRVHHDDVNKMFKKYPKAQFNNAGGLCRFMYPNLAFNQCRFIDRIIENSGVLDEMKITVDGEEI